MGRNGEVDGDSVKDGSQDVAVRMDASQGTSPKLKKTLEIDSFEEHVRHLSPSETFRLAVGYLGLKLKSKIWTRHITWDVTSILKVFKTT